MRNYEPIDLEQLMLQSIFGVDQYIPHSLAEAYKRGQIPAKFLPEAIKIMNGYPYPRKPNCIIGTRNWETDADANGAWANVVMAYEEDV